MKHRQLIFTMRADLKPQRYEIVVYDSPYRDCNLTLTSNEAFRSRPAHALHFTSMERWQIHDPRGARRWLEHTLDTFDREHRKGIYEKRLPWYQLEYKLFMEHMRQKGLRYMQRKRQNRIRKLRERRQRDWEEIRKLSTLS